MFFPPAAGEGSDIVPHQSSIWDDLDDNVPDSAADDVSTQSCPNEEDDKERCKQVTDDAIDQCLYILPDNDKQSLNFQKCVSEYKAARGC